MLPSMGATFPIEGILAGFLVETISEEYLSFYIFVLISFFTFLFINKKTERYRL
jgi:hypothetical protein